MINPLSFLQLLWRGRILVLLAACAVLGLLWHMRGKDIDALETEVERYQQSLATLQRASDARAEASARHAETTRTIEGERSHARDSIHTAPAGADGPVAPVLRDAIDRLYARP
jgi:hypothetical protein